MKWYIYPIVLTKLPKIHNSRPNSITCMSTCLLNHRNRENASNPDTYNITLRYKRIGVLGHFRTLFVTSRLCNALENKIQILKNYRRKKTELDKIYIHLYWQIFHKQESFSNCRSRFSRWRLTDVITSFFTDIVSPLVPVMDINQSTMSFVAAVVWIRWEPVSVFKFVIAWVPHPIGLIGCIRSTNPEQAWVEGT